MQKLYTRVQAVEAANSVQRYKAISNDMDIYRHASVVNVGVLALPESVCMASYF